MVTYAFICTSNAGVKKVLLTFKYAFIYADTSPHRNTLHTSGWATIVFWQIGALTTIVYNLKTIANFGNLNVFCYINEIYWVADIW